MFGSTEKQKRPQDNKIVFKITLHEKNISKVTLKPGGKNCLPFFLSLLLCVNFRQERSISESYFKN